MSANNYEGTMFTLVGEKPLTYSISATDQRPEITCDGKTYKSQNRLLTSDDWAYNSTGTNGDNHPTKLTSWVLSMTYDGHTLTTYRNGLVDQVVEIEGFVSDDISFTHEYAYFSLDEVCHSPMTVQMLVAEAQQRMYEERNRNLPHALINGDFEGSYAPMQGSGVSSDRAIYVPEGWTVTYTSRNENDLTALKSGDLYFDRFFGSLELSSPESHQSYWVRQNWGTSTITLSQQLLLPDGKYNLKVSLWKSGLGGDAFVKVATEDGATLQSASLENLEAWQDVTIDFESDGIASTTIALTAMHNYNGTEKIIGFDNVIITKHQSTGIDERLRVGDRRSGMIEKIRNGDDDGEHQSSENVYDLQGHRLSQKRPGIIIQNGEKYVTR